MSVVSVVCCQVERSLRRADHSSRGVLPTVMCRFCVISKTSKNEVIARDWAASGIEKKSI